MLKEQQSLELLAQKCGTKTLIVVETANNHTIFIVFHIHDYDGLLLAW